MFGIFSLENNCFIRLKDISNSPVHPALRYAVIGFPEREGAEESKATIEMLAGLKQLEVRKLA